MVQLGAYKNAKLAKLKLSEIKTRFESLLKGKIGILHRTKNADGILYRLRVLGFTNIHAARQFCENLKIENTDCFTVLTNNISTSKELHKDLISLPVGKYLEFSKIGHEFRSLISGKKSLVQTFENAGSPFYRLRISSFADIQAARTFCSQLRVAGKDCFPVSTH